jgi:hypothetical protein
LAWLRSQICHVRRRRALPGDDSRPSLLHSQAQRFTSLSTPPPPMLSSPLAPSHRQIEVASALPSSTAPRGRSHYARTLKWRRVITKKGDAQSTHLRRCVTHYNVIENALKCTLPISQYRRHDLQMLVSHYVEKLRRVIRVTRITLDDYLSYSDTNRRHMFNEARIWLSYAPGECLQAIACILELTRIRQLHSTCRSHIFTFTYKGIYG